MPRLDRPGQVRQCEACKLPVTNLSALNEAQAKRALARGGCFAFLADASGNLVLTERRALHVLQPLAFAVAVAACSAPADAPAPAPATSSAPLEPPAAPLPLLPPVASAVVPTPACQPSGPVARPSRPHRSRHDVAPSSPNHVEETVGIIDRGTDLEDAL